MGRRAGNALRQRDVTTRRRTVKLSKNGSGQLLFQATSRIPQSRRRAAKPARCLRARQRRRQAICNRSARGQRRGCCYQVFSNLRLPGSRGLPDTFFRPLPPHVSIVSFYLLYLAECSSCVRGKRGKGGNGKEEIGVVICPFSLITQLRRDCKLQTVN